MDWRFFAGGAAMIAVGIAIGLIFGVYLASGPLEQFNQNRAIAQFGAIIGGIGFLLLLVSFGFSRKKKGSSDKSMTATDKPS